MSKHPITPPTKLIREWNEEAATAPMADQRYIAIQAARWGFRQCTKVDAAWLEDKLQKARDQELEACCEWLRKARNHGFGYDMGRILADNLRAARRPKPPSLAEQALTQLDSLHADLKAYGFGTNTDTIRRALERLQELEEGSD